MEHMMKFFRDKIVGFGGSWGSGLAALKFEHGSIYCDNGPAVRMLNQLYPGFIQPDHTVDSSRIAGKEVIYFYDDMGLTLGGLMPIDRWNEQWQGPEIPAGSSLEFSEDEIRKIHGVAE